MLKRVDEKFIHKIVHPSRFGWATTKIFLLLDLVWRGERDRDFEERALDLVVAGLASSTGLASAGFVT